MKSEQNEELCETEQTVFEVMRGIVDEKDDSDVRELIAQANEWSSSLSMPDYLRDPNTVFNLIQTRFHNSQENQHPVQNADRAFSTFVKMQRRARGVSVESLAAKAEIDQEELERIETDSSYEPRPRTIRQLALFFNIPSRSLAKLAHLRRQTDERLVKESVAFAACANNMDQLTREQRAALKAFVKVLNSIQ